MGLWVVAVGGDPMSAPWHMGLDDITAQAQARILKAAEPVDDLCKHVDCDALSDCSEPLANAADDSMPYCPYHRAEALADYVEQLEHDAWSDAR